MTLLASSSTLAHKPSGLEPILLKKELYGLKN